MGSTEAPLDLVVVVGSVRPGRLAPVVRDWVFTESALTEWAVDLIDLAEVDLPPDLAGESPVAARLARADAFLLITPEYNHSFPAPLKNFIDWHKPEWRFKPVTFVGYGGASGGLRAVEQLRQVFCELYATTTRNAVALPFARKTRDAHGALAPGDLAADALRATLHELRWWATALRAHRLADPFRPL